MIGNETGGSGKGKLTPEPTPAGDNGAHCRVDIRIDTPATVNIYNCTSGPPCPERRDDPRPPPAQECAAGPIAPGQCVPLAIGSKPKQSLRTKLDSLLQNTRVPSAIASGFFQHARRFSTGQPAANPLETEVFSFFRTLPPESKSILACSVSSFDGITRAERDRLFASSIPQNPNVPLDADALATAFVKEINQRVGVQVFDDPHALEQERPGQNRFFDTSGGESFEIQLRICTINGLRTNEFAPPLNPGEYLSSELQQHCVPIVVNGAPQLDCAIQKGNCPGNFLSDTTCLRVPDVRAGEGVVLEGVNFISTDSKVRLTGQAPSTTTREVDAFVFGDLDTPLTEVIDGQARTIRDCRVHDRITFVVPKDLPPAVYSVQVVVPNVSGFPVFGDSIVSNSQFIRISPAPTSRFRVASETLGARQETSPASFGSDEVRVRVRAYPIIASLTALTLGAEQAFDSPEFGDMDSGEIRQMQAVLFDQTGPMDGMVMTIMGFEIDSEKAYRDQINSFTDAFLHYLKIALAGIAASITAGAFAVGVKDLMKFALSHPIILAIAAAVVLVVILILAAWAPADLLIEDSLGFTLSDLDALTSADLPLPVVAQYISQQGIKVKIVPLEKIPTQYRERREYRSDAEDSRYEIVLRYNRVA
ncbi:MAG: hypothetical protein JWO68_4049 [Actinomycetia bacterium]|nr:hypothetical protein [Actinomycetes bacterium]